MDKNLWKHLLVIFCLILALNYFSTAYRQPAPPPSVPITYSRFKEELKASNISSVVIQGKRLHGQFKEPIVPPSETGGEAPQTRSRFFTHLPPFDDSSLLPALERQAVEVRIEPVPETSAWVSFALYILPWVLIIGVWWFLLKGMRSRGGPGGVMGSFAKSGAKLYSRETSRVTFEDVAGLESAKQELMEVVEFLRKPEQFTRLGGKVPRGVLLVGPPGTGKTLMARAVAGEAEVPFFSISASQFIEMFVGVGASRVRDLFKNAKKNAPSIIFIDELDAVGRARGTGLGGGNDEREQTLNQLLSELDGFEPHDEVIIMAATNRPDVLDSALLRPGRFDREVTVERPDWRAREGILKVHTRKMPLEEDVELSVIARGTPGMSGAELESLVNEAALLAARQKAESIAMEHLEEAKDKILMGAEKRLVMSDQERRLTAFHESGHALVALMLPGTDPIHKVTIIPHGRALGVTQQLPDDDRYHYPQSYLLSRLAVMMGGRCAERLVFDECSTGAENDLQQATSLAEKMVCQWGMSEKVGPVTLDRGQEHPFLGRKLATEKVYSEQMAWLIDQEIERILKEAEQRAEELLKKHRPHLERLAEALVESESLDRRDVEVLLEDLLKKGDE